MAQSAAGGVLQLMPLQGSPLQLLPVQPKLQVTSLEVYWQAPLAQVPAVFQVRSVEALRQALAGGWLQVTVVGV